MMSKSREYLRDAGTGLLLSLLVFATLLVAIPAPIQPALAAQAPPTITISPTVFLAAASTSVTVEFTNPSGNNQPLVDEVVTFPSNWTDVSVTSPTTGCSVLGATVSCSVSVPPTATLSIAISATAPSPASFPAVRQVQTSFRYSGEGFRTGPSLTVYIVDPTTTLSVSPSPASIGAGSSSTITATLSPAQAGIPILFSITSGPGSLSASSAMTDSSGKASVTYTSTVADSATIEAKAGGNPDIAGSTSVTVNPGSPAKVSVKFTSGFATHYLTTSGTDAAGAPGATMPNTDVKYGVTDSFGNPIDFSSLSGLSVTLTALTGGGRFNVPSPPAPSPTTKTSITCPDDFTCPTSGTTANLPFDYFQGPDFNTVGTISVTISGSSPAFGPIAATTGNIITSTFAPSSPTPMITGDITSASDCAPAPAPCQQAGKTVTVSATISPVQKNVPVTLYVCTTSTTPPFTCATTSGYAGTFSNGQQKITLMTDSTGTVSDNFAVDTHAGSAVQFVAEVARPVDDNPAATLGNSTTPSGKVTTIAADPATFRILLCFKQFTFMTPVATCPTSNAVKTSVVNGTTIYVDIALADQFGNTAKNTFKVQIQVSLSASAGALSATSVYIPSGASDTFNTFGSISWALPAAVGVTATLTASGTLGSTPVSVSRSVTTVSPQPSLFVTSPTPIAGFIYSKSTPVIFSGNASISAGYPVDGTVTIDSVCFTPSTGPSGCAAISPSTSVLWSAVVTLPANALSTVTFNATDSNGNTVVSPAFKVLVDTSAPSISFVTANGSTIQAGGAVQATIVDTLGDLNFTSVSATRNGTAIPSSSISISGTNNPGANTTYSVSISGLPTGTWVIKVSACDLAGNCATSKALLVTVTVPLDQSFTLVGTPGKVTVAGQVAINATFTNNLPFTQSGIVMLVVRNLQGQAIYIATATVSPAAGATFSALLVVSPVPPGTYNAELFAITSTGVVIAKSTTFSITLP